MRPSLVATVHDPEGHLLDATCRFGDLLSLYKTSYFRCTDVTHRSVLDALARLGDVSIEEPDLIGRSRREVLRYARAEGAETILYCDFDRWLHWAWHYQRELIDMPQAINQRCSHAWYVCLGRTPRAFTTHPRVQRETEELSNDVISLLIGQPLDATAGACWMTGRAADIILSESIEESNATDLEWPALIAVRDRSRIGGMCVDGLEFETASFHPHEIDAAGGLDAWLSIHYERLHVWEMRMGLMAQSVKAALRVFDAAARAQE
jgi:hypothetical protein